jgi:hypothetical protein
MAVTQEQQLKHWLHLDLHDSSGKRIGAVDGLFYDQATGRPEWLLVNAGLPGGKRALVPRSMVEASGGHLAASFTKDHVDDTLHLAADETPTEQQRHFLCRYWGLPDKPLGTRWQG